MNRLILFLLTYLCVTSQTSLAQDRYELHSGWKCMNISKVQEQGTRISQTSYKLTKWIPAVVPGTVLTTMLENKMIPDPFYGMNNERIPDIYHIGRDYYTYWFTTDFVEKSSGNGEQVWLTFRGINYSCDLFLNGQKVNQTLYEGMFLRKTFNITKFLSKDGKNRLAVVVYPPNTVGNPNGGQGGDGTIAKGVAHQYVAGWDWIRPIRDRNTGIWDKVYIEKTGQVNLKNPHVVTLVPGIRTPNAPQANATVHVSAELENVSDQIVKGKMQYELGGKTITREVSLKPGSLTEVYLPVLTLENPKLWWPAGYGPQNLYQIKLSFIQDNQKVSDTEDLTFGVREIQTEWNTTTLSKEIRINGQRLFIKGGNWIISDAMLRFSKERYDAEIRYHRDMNLNLIRIWGGALPERPEFYEACDRYGLLVIQDFWMSGDCNGRWVDPMKLEDQWARRKYPDNHALFLESAKDVIKMIRNHPSLAIWCGGNEIMPPEDILLPLRDSLLPTLDGTRWFIEYSNSDQMSKNTIGGNGDGPYTIQPVSFFWEKRTFPFNSEVGSVGVGDYESLQRFIPEMNLVLPVFNPGQKPNEKADSVWDYHTYGDVGYKGSIKPYGEPKDVRDFTMKAQLVNYDQYRALMEGYSSHMWEWYTGTIIWKTQNPWTSMRGQMYDCYLDPNACLFGLRKGSEVLHAMFNPVDGSVMMVNNGFEARRDLMLVIKTYDMQGKESLVDQSLFYIEPSQVKKYGSIKARVDELFREKGGFLRTQILDTGKKVLSDNCYWIPDAAGNYSGLQEMGQASLRVEARRISDGKIEVILSNPSGNPLAFFNRISLIDAVTKERILPAFYNDNYVTVIPGETLKTNLEYNSLPGKRKMAIEVKGWNTLKQIVEIK